MFGNRTFLIVSLCFANVLCHSEERSDVRIAGNGHLVKECGYPSGRLPRRCKQLLAMTLSASHAME